MMDRPACSSKYYPSQPGTANASSVVPESDGAPGEKMAMPSAFGSMASDEGYHDTYTKSAKSPVEVSGPIETAEPNKTQGQ